MRFGLLRIGERRPTHLGHSRVGSFDLLIDRVERRDNDAGQDEANEQRQEQRNEPRSTTNPMANRMPSNELEVG
ncbi:MAG: hypothetical protein ABI867_10160 [Kofleriaceae bacterium]